MRITNRQVNGVTVLDIEGKIVNGQATNRGGALKLLNVTKQVDQLLIITKLETVMDCFEDEAAALASFG